MLYGTLSNGVQIPLVGLGTYKIPNEEMRSVLQKAFECGYRKIDTARYYKNEEVIGEAISEIGIPRNDLFITTKMDVESLYQSVSFMGRRKKCQIESRVYAVHFFNKWSDYIQIM